MKVFVTGMGAVSSLGLTVDETWSGLREGKTGVREMRSWRDYRGLHTYLGAPVPEYDVSRIPRAARRTMSRMSELAWMATVEALTQARLPANGSLSHPARALCLGSTTGSPEALEAYFKRLFERGGPEGQFSTSFFKIMNHSVASNVALALGFVGPVLSSSSACSTSSQSIILGWELIQAGLYDIVIAGGADEMHFTSAAVFDVVQAASRGYNDSPERSPRPFDAARDGLVVSEGAGVVILESERSVARRGIEPLARFVSGAYLGDGTHMSQPQADTMAATMRLALDRADWIPEAIGYVNAHATGTVLGDIEEAKATASLFGAEIPVSSLKGHLGHSMAACGAIELIVSVRMMQEGLLLPTRNLEAPDPQCALVDLVREPRSVAVRSVMSNNFAFGGMNTSLIVSGEEIGQ